MTTKEFRTENNFESQIFHPSYSYIILYDSSFATRHAFGTFVGNAIFYPNRQYIYYSAEIKIYFRHSLFLHGFDGLFHRVPVLFLHGSVHGRELYLPLEILLYRTVLHRGKLEAVRGVPQLQHQTYTHMFDGKLVKVLLTSK